MKKIFSLILMLTACISLSAQDNSTPLRIGVAGVTHGHLGEVVGRMNRGDYQIVGVFEKNDTYRANNGLTGKLPASLFYADLGKMLDETKPEVVVAYGSIYDHLSVVEACAPRHIHVMVEKPLATTVKQVRRIEALAKQYGIKVMTNFETTWYSSNHHAKEMVENGEIGQVRRINVFDGHEGPAEIGCDDKFLEWLTDPVLNGGGAVIDFGCYGANLATWIMKGQRPTSVYAVLQHNKPSVYPKVDDDATIILEYPGTTVQIMGSWCWPYSRKDMYIYGDKGYIYQKNSFEMQMMKTNGPVVEFNAPKMAETYQDSYRFLKAYVRGEIDIPADDLSALGNNIIVCEILEAAKKSAKTGKKVKL